MDREQFFRELCTVLGREGFTTQPEQDDLLPVEWDGSPLCRITEGGGVRYWQEDVATSERDHACERATNLACMVQEYMTLMEQAPPLKAQGLSGDFRVLADFNGTVLAGHPTQYGVHFVTWDWNFDRTGLSYGRYLAKRLDSFDVGEFSQFQAMAEKLNLTSMKDLINLTFCCQQATVITDFSDLATVGRSHYLNTHGGCASTDELEHLDGEETAILLIEGNKGTVTRYGVVYNNGMQLSQLYDGKHLPGYHYEADMIMVGLVSRQEPENTKNVTWIYLPASKGQIERAIQRSGIVDPKDMCFRMGDSMFPEEVDVALDFRCEDIYELNDLAQAVGKLSHNDCIKLGAAVSIDGPECANQIRHLAENLELFEFAPGAHTPAEYGKYMIQESGHFEYDPNLDEFYDYERYGLQHMDQESGMFTNRGYIAYQGTLSLEELMMEDPTEAHEAEYGLQMGGM